MSDNKCDCPLCQLAVQVQERVQNLAGLEVEFTAVHSAIANAIPGAMEPVIAAARAAKAEAAAALQKAAAPQATGCGDAGCGSCGTGASAQLPDDLPEEVRELLSALPADAEVKVVDLRAGGEMPSPAQLAAMLGVSEEEVRNATPIDLTAAAPAGEGEKLLNPEVEGLLKALPQVLKSMGVQDTTGPGQRMLNAYKQAFGVLVAALLGSEDRSERAEIALKIEELSVVLLEAMHTHYHERWAARDVSALGMLATTTRIFAETTDRINTSGIGAHPGIAPFKERLRVLAGKMAGIMQRGDSIAAPGNETLH